jgi:amidohydrolase
MPTATHPSVRDAVRAVVPHATTIRHDLHQHPELMFEEHRTAGVVAKELDALGIAHVTGLARGTGVLGFLPATAPNAKTVALRADMDALPILEDTGKPYASRTPGTMHACGHDGHTAILLGTARALAAMPERRNNVVFIFQPAEEGGAGGEKMCLEGALDGSRIGTPVDMIYGLHAWPDQEVGTVATRVGPLLAATDEFDAVIRGKGGHAAYPHRCIDPIVVAAHVITALQTIASRRFDPTDSVVVTVGSIHAGTTYNVIPDSATIQGTVRTLTDESRRLAEAEVRCIITEVSEALGAEAKIDWSAGYPCTRNDEGATRRFQRIATEAFGADRVIEKPTPSMGGEDFSYYGQRVPACFFLLGLRPRGQSAFAGLHTPRFDFNDEAIPTAIEAFVRVATEPV